MLSGRPAALRRGDAPRRTKLGCLSFKLPRKPGHSLAKAAPPTLLAASRADTHHIGRFGQPRRFLAEASQYLRYAFRHRTDRRSFLYIRSPSKAVCVCSDNNRFVNSQRPELYLNGRKSDRAAGTGMDGVGAAANADTGPQHNSWIRRPPN